jgi:DNA polymerase I
LTKLKSTYADALPKLINPSTGRVHTSLNQAVTATGRLSSSEPNLQNIPIRTEIGREIRKAFTASNSSLLLAADYSQIELRILAHVTGDTELVRAFRNDEDVHTHTASKLFGVDPEDVESDMRRRAKTINFAVIYGMSDFGLANELGIHPRLAKQYIDEYFDKFPGVRRYTEDTLVQARQKGYVSTLLGRRRYIPEMFSANRNYRMFGERAAVNMPIQGTAADIMKLAMIEMDRRLNEMKVATEMVLQVHDELVFEVPPEELDVVAPVVRYVMENAFALDVELKVDVKVGRNWCEMESVKADSRVDTPVA